MTSAGWCIRGDGDTSYGVVHPTWRRFIGELHHALSPSGASLADITSGTVLSYPVVDVGLGGKMMLSRTIEPSDPLIDVEDKFPLLSATGSSVVTEPTVVPVSPIPLGFRFASHPVRAGKHGKTYTTVEETKDTERCDDGKVYTIPDTVRREEETD